jgi:phosphate transport system substrate-binding protein
MPASTAVVCHLHPAFTCFSQARHTRVTPFIAPAANLAPKDGKAKEDLLTSRRWAALAATGSLALGAVACGGEDQKSGGGAQELKGSIAIDGSSTVFPFAQAAAEQFMGENQGVRITVGQSGTGGGFEKFCAGETQISTASRPIKEDEEVPICEKNGVAFTEVQVASDGIAVATNKDLVVDCMTTKQLNQLWKKGSKASTLSQIDPKLPDEELSLFGPGTDSGTFDFFTDEINGEEGNTRKDYQPSEDDNVLVQGVSGEPGGFGYFGFSYYEANQDKLSLVGIDGGAGCVKPSLETIQSGEYKPLSRPIYVYPSEKALQDPATKAFMDYMLENHQQVAEAAKIVPMSQGDADKSKQALAG